MTLLLLLAVLLILAAGYAALLLGRLDNRLGGDMPADPHPSLRGQIREWLGITGLYEHLHEQERTMAKVIDLLNNLVAQQQAASAAQATSFHNIDAAFAKLQDAIANGDATPEVQAAADQLAAGFASLQKAAEDEGRVYEPAQPPADNPPADNGGDVPAQPADGGDTPADNPDVPVVDNGDNTGDQPAKARR